ncbi:MAG: hypothetical protein NTZ73_03145 [Candidatus Diapherotrites archaeon]|nr:hypothetical protein [Candidatus Diapherotrites archaeon]
MAKLENGKLILNEEETEFLKEGKEYSLIPNNEGIFLLIDKEIEGKEKQKEKKIDGLAEEKEQVIGLVKKEKNLGELVEGKFERRLNEKQKKALLQSVAEGKIFVFKLNESYQKGVYRVRDEGAGEGKGNTEEISKIKKEIEERAGIEKDQKEYSLEKDGILVVRNDETVRQFCMENEREIKEGKLRGVKSFDGNYYIMEGWLLNRIMKKALESFKKNPNQKLEELAKNIKTSKVFTKAVCEFLKEGGELLERRREQYYLIT